MLNIKERKYMIAVDLDGTLCKEIVGCIGYPKKPMISFVNKLAENYKILVFTSRPASDREAILLWLKKNKVLYDEVLTDKPLYHVLIDDRAVNPYDLFKLSRVLRASKRLSGEWEEHYEGKVKK